MILYENRDSTLLKPTNALSIMPHLHKHLELIYLFSGKTMVSSGNEVKELHAGQVATVFPLRVHMYEDLEKLSGILLICDPEIFPEFSEAFATMIPENFIVDDTDGSIGDTLSKALDASERGGDYCDAETNGWLTVVFAKIFSKLDLVPHTDIDLTVTERILSYCDENYMKGLSLDILSRETGLSKFYISKVFSNKIKISFPNYISFLRVSAAKSMLRSTDLSIQQISEKIGFATVRNFSRKFSEVTGLSPSEYRKRKSVEKKK